MKIMLFCWADEMKTELLYWATYLAQLPQHFVITPLIRVCDEKKYKDAIFQLSQLSKNVSVNPVYLKSRNASLRNIIFPKILVNDSLSIFKAVKKSKPDVIVCFFVPHAYPLLPLKRIFHFSLCVYAMGSDIYLVNDLPHRILKKVIYNNSKGIFAYSEKLKHRIEEESSHKVTVIPSSADSSFFRPLYSKVLLRKKWGISAKSKLIFTVARLDKMKGIDVLIKSLKTLDFPDTNLWIRGDGPERSSLEKLTASLDLEDKVKFLGFQNRDELLELYNISDLFALTSYSEGLPRVLIEAMACGCTPIVTKVGDVGAVVKDGFNGFTVSPGDHQELGKTINHIFSLPDKTMEAIQKRARHTVEDEFDTKKGIKKMIRAIDSLVGKPALSTVATIGKWEAETSGVNRK